jgi:hypothetical protein
MLLHLVGIGPAAPISLNYDGPQSEISRRSCPQKVELARSGEEDAIGQARAYSRVPPPRPLCQTKEIG